MKEQENKHDQEHRGQDYLMGFKITMLSMIQILVEMLDKTKDQIGGFSREMGTLRYYQI